MNFSIEVIDIPTAAKALNNTPASTFRTWIRRGDIPQEVLKKIGGTYLVKTRAFKEWVENS